MREDHPVSAPQLPLERGRREAIRLYVRRLWVLLVVIAANALLVVGIYLFQNVGGGNQAANRTVSILGIIALVIVSIALLLSLIILLLVETRWIMRLWSGRRRDSRSTAPEPGAAKQDS
jgi:hypothetical protein